MALSKLIGFFLCLRSLLCPCGLEPETWPRSHAQYEVQHVGQLALLESSGLAPGDAAGQYYTLQDGGNAAALFRFLPSGQITDTLGFAGRNRDWEALADSPDGTLYIGDVGNNADWRSQFHIFALRSERTDTLHLYYPVQSQQPDLRHTQWDAEGLYYSNDSLTLFGKARRRDDTHVYRIPDEAGEHALVPHQSFRLRGQITGADINPSGTEVAALAYGKIYFFGVAPNGKLTPQHCFYWPFNGQAEAILYLADDRLLVTNEAGKVWEVRRK